MSPTSWTADEDFDLLLAAVDAIETRVMAWESNDTSRRFPQLVVLLTGDGDRRAAFDRRFAERTERRVHLRTQWFSAEGCICVRWPPRISGCASTGRRQDSTRR